MSAHLNELVDESSWVVSRRIFHDEDIYKRELKLIFEKTWLLIGHESQIPNVGDFVTLYMGENQIILCRDSDMMPRAYLNSCRHKGMRVCRYDEGHTERFYCAYHGWTYDLNGKLRNVPNQADSFPSTFDRADWGLIEVGKLATFRGTVWATWDPDAVSFEDYLGEAREPLWFGLGAWDGGDGPIEVLGGIQKWIAPCNWKFVAENSGGDPLHNLSHASTDRAKIGPREGIGRRDPLGELFLSYTPYGHGLIYEKIDITVPRNHYGLSKITSEYFEDCWRKRLARQGNRARAPLVLGNIFPNSGFHVQQPRALLMVHPRGPRSSELWRMYFVDKEAPEEAKAFLRRYYLSYAGPGGMTEQDDMENWGYASSGASVHAAQHAPFAYVAGQNMQHEDNVIAGPVSDFWLTEQNNRQFYKRWSELMDGRELGAEKTTNAVA